MVTLAIAAGLLAAPAAEARAADAGQVGSWGPLQQYPVVPVSMGVMPDGKIVAWDQANKPPNFGTVAEQRPGDDPRPGDGGDHPDQQHRAADDLLQPDHLAPRRQARRDRRRHRFRQRRDPTSRSTTRTRRRSRSWARCARALVPGRNARPRMATRSSPAAPARESSASTRQTGDEHASLDSTLPGQLVPGPDPDAGRSLRDRGRRRQRAAAGFGRYLLDGTTLTLDLRRQLLQDPQARDPHAGRPHKMLLQLAAGPRATA